MCGNGGENMEQEYTAAVYDEALGLEACRFRGLSRPFPSHFHEYFVTGLVEAGERRLICNGQEYELRTGDVMLLNPGDSHSCVQSGGALDYRSLHLPPALVEELARETAGALPTVRFVQPVVRDGETACRLRALHRLVLEGGGAMEKEEGLLLLAEALFRRYGQPPGPLPPECREEVSAACTFLEANYKERVTLDGLCRHAGLSKAALLRAFARCKGITPYRYLEAVRVNRARELLRQGLSPAQAAQETGFADQSHFTRYFARFSGLTPGAYRELFEEKQITKKESNHSG